MSTRKIIDAYFAEAKVPERLILLFDEFDRYADLRSVNPPGRGFFNDVESVRRDVRGLGGHGHRLARDLRGACSARLRRRDGRRAGCPCRALPVAAFAEVLRRALHSGVTTARSMGGSHFSDVGLRELIAQGHAEGPEMLAAGYHVRPRPSESIFTDEPELGDLRAAGVQGEEAMRRLARAMAAHRVDWIKVTATDRAGLPETDPRRPLYDQDELRALVEEGGRSGLPVAAHAHGDEGGRAAVLAGVRSIEHGTYLSTETLLLMAVRGT